jgi:hypothetical protein
MFEKSVLSVRVKLDSHFTDSLANWPIGQSANWPFGQLATWLIQRRVPTFSLFLNSSLTSNQSLSSLRLTVCSLFTLKLYARFSLDEQ